MTLTSSIDALNRSELRGIAFAHGWFDLAPWALRIGDADSGTTRIRRTFDTPDGSGEFVVEGDGDKVRMTPLTGESSECTAIASRCLSLDYDPAELHRLAAPTAFAWLVDLHAGRYLRSPTLFEDAFKALLTTNTNWPHTRRMVDAACSLNTKRGEPVRFPLPDQVLALGEDDLKEHLRCGYRASGLLQLASEAQTDPEFWLQTSWQSDSAESFANKLTSIRGLGTASATYLCRFYGKPLGYTIDRWVRGRTDELWGDIPELESFLDKRYEVFGKWKPVVFWAEITRYWHARNPDGNTDWWR